MMAFLLIAFIMFFIFSKFYVIAKRKDAANGNTYHSALVFTVFMFACTVLWAAFKYSFKSTVLVLLCLICWPNIKKFFKELDAKNSHDATA